MKLGINKLGIKMLTIMGLFLLITACGPEVGSDAWCKNMKAKKKADWTLVESKDYAKHCLFK